MSHGSRTVAQAGPDTELQCPRCNTNRPLGAFDRAPHAYMTDLYLMPCRACWTRSNPALLVNGNGPHHGLVNGESSGTAGGAANAQVNGVGAALTNGNHAPLANGGEPGPANDNHAANTNTNTNEVLSEPPWPWSLADLEVARHHFATADSEARSENFRRWRQATDPDIRAALWRDA
jgi:hypothetical protein